MNKEDIMKKVKSYKKNEDLLSVKIPNLTKQNAPTTIGSLMVTPVQKSLLLPNKKTDKSKPTECAICKKKILTKYLKYHMEASHDGVALPASMTASIAPPVSTASTTSTPKLPIPSLVPQPKSTCSLCQKSVISK